MKRNLQFATGLALLIGGWMTVGCADPTARRLTQERRDRIDWWVGKTAARERARPDRVRAAVGEIDRFWRSKVAATRQNEREVAEDISDRWGRWDARRQKWARFVGRSAAGKPEGAKRAAIHMFF